MKREMCCTKYMPRQSGERQEGDKFTCGDCSTVWEWTVDESDGGYWEDIDVITECQQQESAELAEESHARKREELTEN